MSVTVHTGANVNGVQVQAEVLMKREGTDKWATFTEGLATWENRVKAMDLRDVEVPLKAIMMNPATGGLYKVGKDKDGALVPTRTALSHLMSYGDDNAPSYNVENLSYYPPELRAAMVAHQLAKSRDRSVNLRTALVGDLTAARPSRVVRAVVSDKHSMEHGDDLQVISQLRRMSDPRLDSAKMRVIREWDYTHVEVVIPNMVIQTVKGGIVQARISLKNSETKGGSFEASAGSMNLVCLNGMIGTGNNTTVSIKHVGDISYRQRMGIKTVLESAEEHLHQFASSYTQGLPGSRADAIGHIVKQYKLPAETGLALATLWDVDGERGAGDTLAGLVNSLTRHAQSMPVTQAQVIEAVAGKVLERGLDALL